jgi:hypothetical protein
MSRRRPLALVTLAAVLVLPTGAIAASGPVKKPLKTYCSQTGDICYGVFRRGSAVFFDLTTAARYFERYTLCVRPPRGGATCRAFRISRSGQLFASSVRWRTTFPDRGAGTYRVTWRLQDPLGPTLAFRRP